MRTRFTFLMFVSCGLVLPASSLGQDRKVVNFYGVQPGKTTETQLRENEKWGKPVPGSQLRTAAGVTRLTFRIEPWEKVVVTLYSGTVYAIDLVPAGEGHEPTSLAAAMGLDPLQPIASVPAGAGIGRHPASGWKIMEPRSVCAIVFVAQSDEKQSVPLVRFYCTSRPATAVRSAETLYLDGLTLIEKLEFDEALEILSLALFLKPDCAEVLAGRASAYVFVEEGSKALADINAALLSEPDNTDWRVTRARAYKMLKQFDQALADLNKALLLRPKDIRGLMIRADTYASLGQLDSALADVDQLLEFAPGLLVAMRLRAGLLAQKGELDLAIAQSRELLKTAPNNADGQVMLATLYTAKGEHREAIKAWTALLTREPNDTLALRARGDARLAVGEHSEAIADYEKALELGPKNDGLLNNMAWVLATSPDASVRDGRRAIELASQACELTEYKQAHIVSTLAAAHAETGDLQMAIKWSQKALELGSEDQREDLTKELESYRAGRPVRERIGSDERAP